MDFRIGDGRPTILVQGATGQVGLSTIQYLGRYTDLIKIRAGVRDIHNPYKIAKLERTRVPMDLSVLDLHHPQSVNRAVKGINKLMICPPNSSDRIELLKLLVQAAISNPMLDHIVLVSILQADPQKMTTFEKEFLALERFIESTGVPFTILRCSQYMENLYIFSDVIIKQDTLALPLSSGRIPLVAVKDIGECASNVLATNQGQYNFKVLSITGPQCLHGEEITQALSERLQKHISWKSVPLKSAAMWFSQSDVRPWHVSALVDYFEVLNYSNIPIMSSDAALVMGRFSTDLKTWTSQNYVHFLEKAEEIVGRRGKLRDLTPTQNQPESCASSEAATSAPSSPIITYPVTPRDDMTESTEAWANDSVHIHRISCSFHSPSGVLFRFPLRYLSAIGLLFDI
eukprot:TRINITY_DN8717_c0_g1_i1.p1 TRINITY_DN8717_c0_g1~~TRINITY_DN8717_c0_g1_i1.p1  ORF type:complete len:401 (-),score=77.22 TRINITY_DN8717_c0_g1_i1:27-1229(-)